MDWLFVVNTEEKYLTFPTGTQLFQNYPNPFNPETVIDYYLNERSHVTLTVYNSIGKKVKVLVDEVQSSGFHVALFSKYRPFFWGLLL